MEHSRLDASQESGSSSRGGDQGQYAGVLGTRESPSLGTLSLTGQHELVDHADGHQRHVTHAHVAAIKASHAADIECAASAAVMGSLLSSASSCDRECMSGLTCTSTSPHSPLMSSASVHPEQAAARRSTSCRPRRAGSYPSLRQSSSSTLRRAQQVWVVSAHKAAASHKQCCVGCICGPCSHIQAIMPICRRAKPLHPHLISRLHDQALFSAVWQRLPTHHKCQVVKQHHRSATAHWEQQACFSCHIPLLAAIQMGSGVACMQVLTRQRRLR